MLLSDIGFGFGWSCVEPGVGLDDPCRSLPAQEIFYGSVKFFLPNTYKLLNLGLGLSP